MKADEQSKLAESPGELAEIESGSELFSARKLLVQLLGFGLGLTLLAWCIRNAIKGGGEGWQHIRDANPLLIAGLLASTLVSLFVNGTIFWLVIRPVHPLLFCHMQFLNLVTSVLNYAPVRAGLIARIAYHIRVDRMPLLTIGGWFAAIGYTLVLTVGAIVLATVIRPSFDWLWFALLAGQLVIGGLMTTSIMNLPLIKRIGKGMDRMLREKAALWGAIGLRIVDVAAFAGRMGCAAAILKLEMPLSNVLLLAIIAIAVSLNPLGRFGYREAGVAFFAAYLGMSGPDFESQRNQLALIESAGEAIIAIPLGCAALVWYRQRWMNSKAQSNSPAAVSLPR